jgi:hypothetical protein
MKTNAAVKRVPKNSVFAHSFVLLLAILLLLPAFAPNIDTLAAYGRLAKNRSAIIAPALVNPSSPHAYGAKCDGVTDDTRAFQKALDRGDVLVPPGTCIINRTVEISMSHRHLECSPGTTLKQTDPYAGRMFSVISKTGEALVGDSIANCNFVGANDVAPAYFDDDARHWNIPVQTHDRVSRFMLIGNKFSRFFGQAMFQTYGQIDGGSDDIIAYNEFSSCGYYGPVLVAHRNGYIGHNVLVDCAIGVENDNAQQMTGGNIIEFNSVTAIRGYGAPDMRAGALLTGGAASKADYSRNIVRYNTVSGVSSANGFQRSQRPSLIYQKAPGRPAQYLNNECFAGCSVIR